MKIKLVIILSIMAATAFAQGKQFTLEDLNFGGYNYRNMSPKNQYYEWWGDILVRNDMEACYIVDKKTGTETKLLNLDEINKWLDGENTGRKAFHLYSVIFPYPNKPIVRIYTNKGGFLIDWEAKKVIDGAREKEFGKELEWCAASKATAWLKDNNLYVETDGNIHQLTQDGSREIVYGQSVHRDEFGIHKGTFWSPNGMKLAFYRMDQSMVADYPQVNLDTRIATLEPDKYPMAGEESHQVTVGIYDLLTKKTIYLQAGNPKNRYFTNISWSPDSKTIYMFELNREQNDCKLVSYDATTGEKKAELYREQHEKYVEPQNPIVFLPWDADKFIMQSQKDGFNHLYLYNIKGEQLKQITSGNWVVIDFLGFNQKDKTVLIHSNELSPIQKNLFSVNINTGKRTLLDNGRGYHEATPSHSGLWSFDRFSEPDIPRKITVTNNSKNQSKELFVSDNPWVGYNVPEYSCGTIKAADGVTDLYYRMVKPVDFAPQKKYPTVIYVYGGPHAHNVDARWNYGSRGWETYMAQKGYLLFILDNRGSEHRGREFEQSTFRQLGQVEMQDQMKGVEFLKSLPYVDAERMGVHGWSFGGFMTISLMTNYPEVFKVGVAGGPVIDWKWYEVMYGERYMDTPQNNPEGYEKTSLIAKAKELKGKLQIIQGMNDPTVVPQHCLKFIHECNLVGTQPDFYVYPGEGHNMRGHQSTHLHERITQYFEDYLK
ncbi:S9 family peptidase [Bacteroides heparinolyticus]|uniref:S9 family peptidase n=2 Tax=Prevotella heparinolytica TaxID=28113 RepID=UPI00359F7341